MERRFTQKPWWWLAVSLVVSIMALSVLFALQARESEALRHEQVARAYAVQIQQTVVALTPVGLELRAKDPALLSRLALGSVSGWSTRLDGLRAIDAARTDRIARAIARAKRTLSSGSLNQLSLLAISIEVQGTADEIADIQHRRAERAKAQGLFGSFGVMVFAVLLVGGVLTRERQASLAVAARHAEEVRQLAEHDGLTALPNRRRFDQDLAALATVPSHSGGVEIAVCDLNGFKSINDRLGHHAGDQVLTATAAALTDAIGHLGTVYRIGGDEFCVISRPGESIAEPVRSALSGDRSRPSGSVGVASWPADSALVDHVVRLADMRMYADKSAARSAQQPTAA